MPFFCDILTNGITQGGRSDILPYMIPYTTVLYYNAEHKDYGTQNYKPIMFALNDGSMSSRGVNIDVEWDGGGSDSVYHRYLGQKAWTTEGSIEWSKKHAMIQKLKDGKETLRKIFGEVETISGSTEELERFLNQKAPSWNATIQRLTPLLNSQGRRFLTTTFGTLKNVIDIKNRLVGQSVDDLFITKDAIENSSSNLDAVTNTTQTVTIDSSQMKTHFSGATVSSTVSKSSSYAPDSILSINQTITCKSSDSDDAADCLKQLAEILNVVAPNYFYWHTDKSKTAQVWSRMNLCYDAPNQFDVELAFDSTTSNLANNRLETKVSTAITAENTWDVFKYRGEFQLRVGYCVYRNLIPEQITVQCSPDMLLLDDNPFDNLGLSSIESTFKVGEVSNPDSDLQVSDTNVRSADALLTYWKQSKLYNSVYVNGQGKKYLFPQWINITVSLRPFEPLDGITGTQQMFSFSDSFTQTNK